MSEYREGTVRPESGQVIVPAGVVFWSEPHDLTEDTSNAATDGAWTSMQVGPDGLLRVAAMGEAAQGEEAVGGPVLVGGRDGSWNARHAGAGQDGLFTSDRPAQSLLESIRHELVEQRRLLADAYRLDFAPPHGER